MSSWIKTAAIRLLAKTWCVRKFRPHNKVRREALRAYMHGLRIRFLLACGFGVVVIGEARSGKTFMLSRALPGNVIAPDRALVLQNTLPPFPAGRLPDGQFAVEEPQAFQPGTVERAFDVLRGKRVAFSVQSIELMHRLRLDALFGERLAVVFLGTRNEWEKERGRKP
ncbi:hypothetical protein CTQ51_13485 [Salmonella enterica subsp. enterica serovar Infantis]|uniref:hypothetical protein n=1 Tax=Xanthomonas axonopodis TaxID=53413 RepID=UPI001EB3D8BB|nr:hypothetical protein [Salmonella enterica subsp. enterica serovar Infantis]EDL8717218.1 hypothetical protein [Salmonella enterica subsp. enterica serovar Infantis]EDL9232166.1 hypothetical protein [Salmonella enterica subsp. enterica serovar Infantis]EDL9351761.1 hypothetical protein [Salmonella enterica subsp. enterica serovar Infantis]